MKDWAEPSVEEIMISETQYRGPISYSFDSSWFDDNEALHVTMAS